MHSLLFLLSCGSSPAETAPPAPPVYAEKTEAEAAPAREKIASFVGSWAEVAALVPDADAAPVKCTETGGPIPLVDYEDLLATAGKPLPEGHKRLTPPGFLGRLSAPLSPGQAVALAEQVDETVDRIWVRRILSRTEATFVPPSEGTPQTFIPGEVRGLLALVGRLPPRVLCTGSLRAASRDAVSTKTAEADFAELAAKDLDQLTFDVTISIRRELTGDQLDFPPEQHAEAPSRDEYGSAVPLPKK